MSNPPCFSSMVPDISKLHCNEQVSGFRLNVTKIGTASNVFSVR